MISNRINKRTNGFQMWFLKSRYHIYNERDSELTYIYFGQMPKVNKTHVDSLIFDKNQ